jgi:hypothetical protein
MTARTQSTVTSLGQHIGWFSTLLVVVAGGFIAMGEAKNRLDNLDASSREVKAIVAPIPERLACIETELKLRRPGPTPVPEMTVKN